ncbi:hypothetical protein [Mycolicibacterium thermoresistibile]
MTVLKRIPMTYVGYVGFLLTFAFLGLFVHALAVSNPAAWALGAGAVASMALCIAGFRIGTRQRFAANTSGMPMEAIQFMDPPVTKEHVDRYLLMYRGVGAEGDAPATDADTDEMVTDEVRTDELVTDGAVRVPDSPAELEPQPA